MVATNPMFAGSLSLRKFRATVINDIWPEVTFFTLVATAVTLVTKKTDHSLAISSSLLTVLGTVLGLVISFRTSTAYERYQEGRKIWTTLGLASRNLGHMIWNHIEYNRDDKHAPAPTSSIPNPNAKIAAVIEKKSMLNLVHAFAVSVKHLLRGEPGIYYEDLYPLVCFLPRYSVTGGARPQEDDMLPLWKASDLYATPGTAPMTRAQTPAPLTSSPPGELADTAELPMHSGPTTLQHMSASDFGTEKGGRKTTWMSGTGSSRRKRTFDPEQVLPQVESDRPLLPARSPPTTSFFDYFPFLRIFKAMFSCFSSRDKNGVSRRTLLGHKKYLAHVESNVPLEISLFLSSYLAWLLKRGLLTPAIATAITNNISTLQECSVNLQRIRNTPLPFAYQAHLRMSLWLYLLFLPFQIQTSMGWITIPGTTFASFLLLGFLEIGQEIENPFNYDENDLDLDGFCLQIQRELAEITAHTVPSPDAYLFTGWNQPFAPADRRTAEDILRDVAHEYHGPETGMDAVRRTLLKSWRDVDEQTREHYSGWSAEGQ